MLGQLKMKSIITVLSLLLALASPAWSVQLRGMGVTPCHALVSAHDGEGEEFFSVKQWLYGYLSGVNSTFEALNKEEPFPQIYFDAVYNSTLRYCREHEEELVFDGLRDFVNRVLSK